MCVLLIAVVFFAAMVSASQEEGRDGVVGKMSEDLKHEIVGGKKARRHTGKSDSGDDGEGKKEKKTEVAPTTACARLAAAWGSLRAKTNDCINGVCVGAADLRAKLPAVNARYVRNAAAVAAMAALASYYYANKEAVDQAFVEYYGNGVDAYNAYMVNGTLPNFGNFTGWNIQELYHQDQ